MLKEGFIKIGNGIFEFLKQFLSSDERKVSVLAVCSITLLIMCWNGIDIPVNTGNVLISICAILGGINITNGVSGLINNLKNKNNSVG